jgi:TonB family protein
MSIKIRRRVPSVLLVLLAAGWARAASPQTDRPAAPPQSLDEATRHNAAGISKSRNRDLEGAIAEFSEAIRLDPSFAEAFRNRGEAEASQANFDAAFRDFSQAIDLNPRFAAALNSRGVVNTRRREFDHAIEDFSRALEIDPNLVSALDNRARARSGKSDFDGAIADLTSALTLSPKVARLYNNRGYAKSRNHDVDGAIADYDQALALDPKYVIALVNRGDARRAKKIHADAATDYTAAIVVDPQRQGAYYGRGLARLDLGNRDDAIADFTRVIELNSKYVNALLARCRAYREKKEFAAALADCTQAISLTPESARAFVFRGETKADQGDVEGAVRDFADAIRLDPRDGRAYYDRCRMAIRTRDYERAMGDCTEAVRLDATLAGAYYDRAVALESQGDATAAEADFARAKALDPKLTRPTTFVVGMGTGGGASAAGGTYRAGGGVTAPTVKREVKPKYTGEALEAHIQGTVLLEAVVGIDGSVTSVRVLRSLDPFHGLDQEAMNAARQWTFEPGVKDGKPVPVIVTVELAFTIADGSRAAAFKLPDAFSTRRADPPGADDDWQEQTVDSGDVKVHMAHPKGWITMTGLPNGVTLLQSQKEPVGVGFQNPTTAPGSTDSPATDSALRVLADTFEKNFGSKIDAYGQARVNARLWFWFDLGAIKRSAAGAAPSVAALPRMFDETRIWYFVTLQAERLCPIMFYVNRPPNASAADANQAIADAGPLFVRILESLSFAAR